MITTTLLDEAKHPWADLPKHAFLERMRAGTLDPAAFTRWLAQDYLFVVDFTKLMAHLFSLAPRRDHAMLLAGFGAIADELQWFESHLTSRGHPLPSPTHTSLATTPGALNPAALPGDACVAFCNWMVARNDAASTAADVRSAYRMLLVAFWAMEHAYNIAWGSLKHQSGVSAAYAEYVDRWTNPAFSAYVDDLRAAVDREFAEAGVTPGSDEWVAAHQVVADVVRLERDFWSMCLGANDQ
ncbi:hypothetical protein BC828DRAFT_392599 [Blastocladiella britannica]|nr:hypothetical protein BC828DRAFT_392599 [Blastocladiella britannica]